MSIKLHFCCGKNQLEGWENHDRDVDITQCLPYLDDYADFIYCEHGLEHVPIQHGVHFLKECYRILKPNGVVRIAIPCVDILRQKYDERYEQMKNERPDELKKIGFPAMNKAVAVYQLAFSFKHQTVFTIGVLNEFMKLCGFQTNECNVNESQHPELRNMDGLRRRSKFHIFWCQTGVVEGTKPSVSV
jgi:predicted SAM-dependent methyltransferase